MWVWLDVSGRVPECAPGLYGAQTGQLLSAQSLLFCDHNKSDKLICKNVEWLSVEIPGFHNKANIL